jgi:amino acid adenylation domain-containing protein
MTDVLQHVVENVRRRPQHVALKDAQIELTYEQLSNEVQRVAASLLARGVTSGDRVVLLLQNSIEYVIAALGCLWIEAIFVPLDASDPVDRVMSLMSDCDAVMVLTNGAFDEPKAPLDVERSPFMSIAQLLDEAVEAPVPIPTGEHPAYIIYTSGTTGVPKGVTVGSSAFEAAIYATCHALGLGPATRTLSVSPFHFDGSFATLFATLVAGGTLVVRPRESLLFPRFFVNTVVSEAITYTGFTPSYLRALEADSHFDELSESQLEIIALGGEACSVGDAARLWSVLPHLRIFNRYGPTETIIAATHIEITPSMVAGGVIPIGQPHPGVQFYLFDESNHLVVDSNTLGELYIGGRQLMNGYWNSPELSSKVLRTDLVEGEKLYKTGDIVYADENGDYVYVDRADRVVKRKGVRISLLEVTDAFRKIDGVEAATTISFDADDAQSIVTFLVLTSEMSRAELRKRASSLLPSSMLPDRIEIVETIPLSPAGKTDDKRLLAEAGIVARSNLP